MVFLSVDFTAALARFAIAKARHVLTVPQTFAKKDLPSEHRVIKEGDMFTQDHKPDRLNIHVGDDGTVNKVTHG